MQIRTILGIIILGFAGTLLLHSRELAQWWTAREPHGPASPPGVRRSAGVGTPAPPGFGRFASSAAGASASGAGARAEGAAEPEAPPSDPNTGPPLPVMLAIRPGAPRPESPGGGRELDLVNASDEPLTVTVLVAEALQGEFFVLPRAEEHLGPESGIDLEPGSQVTLRSPGYHQLTEIVR